MPDFPIVDSHVHFFNPAAFRYDWLSERPKINRRWLPGDFAAAAGPVEVEKIVFTEAGANAGFHLQKAKWADALVAAEPRLAGIIAALPLESGAGAEADLQALAELPTLRGVRRLIETERDPSFCLEPAFLEGVRLLARYDLPFDLCVKHWALVFATEVARRCPDVRFVLDHIGKPGIRHGLRQPWWSGLCEIAALPNVACKISGVITEADHETWSEAAIRPYIEHAIECFGFDRILFGSDWPVSTLTHGYPDWVAILDRILAGCSPDELDRFYRTNAIRVYRL